MLHNFKVENFYSIYEEQELSFTSKRFYGNSFTEFDDYYVSNVNCLIGANASGKTNILKALYFLLRFAQSSFYEIDESIVKLYEPHKLKQNEPTCFELTFDYNKILYRNNLCLFQNKVIDEKLEIKSQKGFSYLYKLENRDDFIEIKYNRNRILPKINPMEENRFKLKKNVTFLSFLLGTGYLQHLQLKSFANDIFSNVSNIDSRSYDHISESVYLSKALENTPLKNALLPYLKNFDFGIENFVEDNTFQVKFKNGESQNLIGFKHSNGNNSFILSALDESAGTIKGTFLMFHLLNVLAKGGVAIIDELDARLHYDIARILISLFANKETNLYNAQLFFSTHQPLFLNDRDKKQIFMCYKEDLLNTEIYRLDEIEGVRNTENFFEKYLAGCYGAVPRIGNI